MANTVAIIGSGPAGLTCAEQLAIAGAKVTVFDELSEFGGMLAYGIPEFRIPLANVRERVAGLEKKGIVFKKQKIVSVKNLLKKFGGKFDYVVLAIGAGNGAKAGFEGDHYPEVIDALEFLSAAKLQRKNIISKGEKVAVVGGGNSAIDASRVAFRQGAKVTIVYRRTEKEMPALKNEIDAAKNDGINFEFLYSPKKFVCKEKSNSAKLVCDKFELGAPDSTGRPKPIPTGKFKEFIFDKVILAIGQQQDYSWLEKEGVKTNGKTVIVNETNATSLENVYACGDAVTGPKTIGAAVKSGIITSKAIISKLK